MRGGFLAVPMLDLRAQYAGIRAEVEAAIARTLESQRFVLGPEVEAFEREFAAWSGLASAVSCASGSDALLMALMELGVGPGDRVACPAFSFYATASAIARLGARPVFVDIDPLDYTLAADDLRRRAARAGGVRAVIAVDLFGRAADWPALEAAAAELDATLIADSAQAVGARDALGRPVGRASAAACFSLYPTKNLGAYGDGGIVACEDPERAARLRQLRSHGASEPYLHPLLGINSRLDALQAAVLRVKLAHLDAWTKARQEHAARYDRAFAEAGALPTGAPWSATPSGALRLRTPRPVASPARHVYHQYVVRVPAERRDALRRSLAERGVASEIYYPRGLHQQPSLAALAEPAAPLEATEAATRECLALPIHAELDPDQLAHVVACVRAFDAEGDSES